MVRGPQKSNKGKVIKIIMSASCCFVFEKHTCIYTKFYLDWLSYMPIYMYIPIVMYGLRLFSQCLPSYG